MTEQFSGLLQDTIRTCERLGSLEPGERASEHAIFSFAIRAFRVAGAIQAPGGTLGVADGGGGGGAAAETALVPAADDAGAASSPPAARPGPKGGGGLAGLLGVSSPGARRRPSAAAEERIVSPGSVRDSARLEGAMPSANSFILAKQDVELVSFTRLNSAAQGYPFSADIERAKKLALEQGGAFVTLIAFRRWAKDLIERSEDLCELFGADWRYGHLSLWQLRHAAPMQALRLGTAELDDVAERQARINLASWPERSLEAKRLIHTRAMACGADDPTKADYSKFLARAKGPSAKIKPLDHGTSVLLIRLFRLL